jgi:hypothetical protein
LRHGRRIKARQRASESLKERDRERREIKRDEGRWTKWVDREEQEKREREEREGQAKRQVCEPVKRQACGLVGRQLEDIYI